MSNNKNIDLNDDNKDKELVEEYTEMSDEDFEKFDGDDDFDNINSQTTEEKFDLLYHLNTNKHKQDGKHSLKTDVIFKGKIDKPSENEYHGVEVDDYSDMTTFFNYESEEYSNYVEQNNLIKDIYSVLDEKTELDFTQNRRKPNKETFNKYYDLLITELSIRYTKSELFVELSYYFTDNIFNMFKLLDKKHAAVILKELKAKGFLGNLDGINFL